MGRAGKWLRSFFLPTPGGRRDGKSAPASPVLLPEATPQASKRRWSFRRPSTSTTTTSASAVQAKAKPAGTPTPTCIAAEVEEKQVPSRRTASIVEDMAATRIQSAFRGWLARRALCALRGLVKLQALVRGHLVRRQANATLRCMQALVAAQSMVRAQLLRSSPAPSPLPLPTNAHRRSPQRPQHHRRSHHQEMEENVKIVEVDSGEPKRISRSRSGLSVAAAPVEAKEHRRLSTYSYSSSQAPFLADQLSYYSPAQSVLTELSPEFLSGHLEEFSFATAQSSPQHSSSTTSAPNYMANTESSRAKSRSQSAPKQRTDGAFERQPSRRKVSAVEGRGLPKGVKMQRSSSHVGMATAGGQCYYYCPWPVTLDRSSFSVWDSELGSTTSSIQTAGGEFCRSVAGFEVRRDEQW